MEEQDGLSASNLRERDEATDTVGDEAVDVQDSGEHGADTGASEGEAQAQEAAPDETGVGQDTVREEERYNPVEDARRLHEHLIHNRSQVPRRASGLIEGLAQFLRVHG